MQTSLTCSGNGALINGGNVKRHYETKHSLFEQSYPLKSKLKYEIGDRGKLKETSWTGVRSGENFILDLKTLIKYHCYSGNKTCYQINH